LFFFFFQAEDGIRDGHVTGVQTCALPILECLTLAKPQAAPSIIDIGTGSGNLAVAIAKHHAGARITAVDLSAEALAVARRNAERSEERRVGKERRARGWQ